MSFIHFLYFVQNICFLPAAILTLPNGPTTRETIRQSTSQGFSSFVSNSLETSLAGNATTTGLWLAHSHATKKVRLIRISVKAGYRVFLQDMTQKH